MSTEKYVIGLDYGTDSVRALIVDTANGKELGTSVEYYSRWKEGKYCDPAKNQYRQHPLDYLESMEKVIKDALAMTPAGTAEKIIGISFDTTGSTPVFTNENGVPLAMLPEFKDDPNAMFVLWKDHTAIAEADEINALAEKSEPNYIKYEGGIYSSEWVWAKVLHILRSDPKIRKSTYAWIEHCDWMPAILTGKIKPGEVLRSRCASGHKAMWHTDWNGLPPKDFLSKLDPVLATMRDRLYQDTYTSDVSVGTLTSEWAQKLGLSENVAVGVGAFDCHMGAVGAEITPNVFVRVMGTSTCDILISEYDEMEKKLVRGICGQVDGSVVPGYIGLEAGQSSFGDVYAWFRRLLSWPLENILRTTSIVDDTTKQKLIDEVGDGIIPTLAEEASKLTMNDDSVFATDWFNGRRTPDANQKLKASISGLNLGSDASRMFRALVEATAFGSKAILDRFKDEGVNVNEIIAIGGVANKSPYVMQVLCDVLNTEIKVCAADQACALGASMFAAVAGGVYGSIPEAQEKMNQGFEKTYSPRKDWAEYYQKQYHRYLELVTFSEKVFV